MMSTQPVILILSQYHFIEEVIKQADSIALHYRIIREDSLPEQLPPYCCLVISDSPVDPRIIHPVAVLGIGWDNAASIDCPLYYHELVDKVAYLLQKKKGEEPVIYQFSSFYFNEKQKILQHLATEAIISVTDTEIAIIKYLYQQRDIGTVTPQELSQSILSHENSIDSHAIPSHIYRLRQKLLEQSIEDELIVTDKNGYRLAE